MTIHDTGNDFIAEHIGMFDWSSGEWAQTGFTEGCCVGPTSPWSTPKVYTEWWGDCPSYAGEHFVGRSTPAGNPRYNEYFRVSWGGSWGYCPQGGTLRIWQFGRGSPSFGTIDVGFMHDNWGMFHATTELKDRKYMEPGGTQCFGGGYLCTPSEYGYDLFLWDQSDGSWYLWDTSHPTIITENEVVQGYPSGYFHNPSPGEPFYRFTTTSGWQ